MRLPTIDWDDPIAPLHEFMKVRMTPASSEDFEAAYHRYSVRLFYLSLIWERLGSDIDAHERRIEILFDKSKLTKTGRLPFTAEEESTIKTAEIVSRTLHLDNEDFLIHSKILMDRVSLLTQFLLPGLKNIGIHRFSKQRRFFLREENAPYYEDEEYAGYIREKTGWFETMLSAYRDNFVVHDELYSGAGTRSGPAELPRVMKTRKWKQEEWSKVWEALLKLRDKYLERIPGLKEVTLNVYELVIFLDEKGDYLDQTDLHTLSWIRSVVGGAFPDTSNLAHKIIEFLNFYSVHFLSRFRGNNRPELSE